MLRLREQFLYRVLLNGSLSGANFKSLTSTMQLLMKVITVLGGFVAGVVFFFAVIFALAASVAAPTTRLATSGILFVIGIVIIVGVYYATRKPKTVIQRFEVSGPMSAAQIKCPHCGGSVEANQIQISGGVPYVKCPYCGTTFEVVEKPKW
jgi:predicted Zn finger-like uncharacterized protein